ncbi:MULTISPECIES: lipid droplet-associated protein [Mycobacterium]|uniref:lipid droplet-associated protein n=1 Tax=Mycobacterium TaxID=1763 RepID=UPI001CDA19D6|nr:MULTISPECIES: lipid droplet-associated protein [Mycobacterium]MCA2242533.1 lipid droplet-associated protein [Mycobacterium sp. WUMAC-067]MCA2314854.1 lipid droplet-associated protein [Mycobacterium sp. WUMAC-025]MEE3753622.1 lipid droplet-associated protein [Mycobacterium intracellulare]
MATAPYGVRLLVGAATVAVEETIRLPKTILMYPMTLASQAAHVVMRFQQNLAELVIKGDSTLESIFPPKDEKPEWATFDEDVDDAVDGAYATVTEGGEGERRAEGRFALYSVAEAHEDASALTKPARPSKKPAADASVPLPAVATELDYSALTLAQLRARLQSLSVDELEELLAYEQATKGRAPFQTLLANRITRANAK